MSPERFEAALRRHDSNLYLGYGLLPAQASRIRRGVEVPYSQRVHCWTVWRKGEDGAPDEEIRALVDKQGRPRPPYDQDLTSIFRGGSARWSRGHRKMNEWQRTQMRNDLGLYGSDEHEWQMKRRREKHVEEQRKERRKWLPKAMAMDGLI